MADVVVYKQWNIITSGGKTWTNKDKWDYVTIDPPMPGGSITVPEGTTFTIVLSSDVEWKPNTAGASIEDWIYIEDADSYEVTHTYSNGVYQFTVPSYGTDTLNLYLFADPLVLRTKKFFEKITTKIRKNKLKGATVKLAGTGSTGLTFDSNATANGSTYVSIVPRGILDTNFVYATNNDDVFEYSTHANSTSSVTYPQIKIKQSGLYLVQGSVYFTTGYTAEDRIYITFYVNNAVTNSWWLTERMSSTYQIPQLIRLIYLNANDVIQLRASNYTTPTSGQVYLTESTQLRLTLMNPTL